MGSKCTGVASVQQLFQSPINWFMYYYIIYDTDLPVWFACAGGSQGDKAAKIASANTPEIAKPPSPKSPKPPGTAY